VNAVAYAGLVGRYIRMERPATAAERTAGAPSMIGMECTVTRVHDSAPGVVTICGADGYAFAVGPDHAAWRFAIWPDEATRKSNP